jgi:sugar lactone lactonase YvrE
MDLSLMSTAVSEITTRETTCMTDRLVDGAPGSLARRLFAQALIVTAAFFVLTFPASAAVSHHYVFQLTGTPAAASSPGPFSGPWGLATDSSDNLWVADIGSSSLVDKFDSSGVFLAQNDGTGSWALSPYVQSLAWDTAASKLFAVDSQNDDLWGLNPDATYSGADFHAGLGAGCCFIKAAADNSASAAAGDLYVSTGNNVSAGNTVVRVDSTGAADNFTAGSDAGTNILTGADTPAGAFSGPSGLAVDAAGNLYVADAGNKVIDEFAPSGAYLQTITGAGALTPFSDNLPSLAVDPTSGHLLVLDAGNAVIDEFDASGGYQGQVTGADTPAGSLGSPQAIALDSTGKLYVSDSANAVVDAFSAVLVPAATTELATAVGPAGATLNGHLDPASGPDVLNCHFDWGTTAAYGHTAPCVEGNTFSAPAAVHADVTGLDAGTTYHFRLSVANANGINFGADLSFSTPPKPAIDAATATNLTAAEADLNARINPNGLDSTYHFEYGTSTSYGASVPVPDAHIGAGTSDVSVTQHIAGLTANTTYHWRVVASSSSGIAAGADHTFVYTTSGVGLSDNRAYEQVTPAQKNGAAIGNPFEAATTISDDGSRLMANTIQCFGDAASCQGQRSLIGNTVSIERAAAGWQTTFLAPPGSQFDGSTYVGNNPNTGDFLFTAPTPPGGQDDFYLRPHAGALVHVGPFLTSAPIRGAQARVVGTADFSRFVFISDGDIWPFDATIDSGDNVQAHDPLFYSGSDNGQPLLVAVSGGYGSTDLIGICGAELGGNRGSGEPGSLSVDGSTVFFTAYACAQGSGANSATPVPVDAIYARINGDLPTAHTVAISQRSPADCTTPGCITSAPADASFVAASADAVRSYFLSTQQLTDDAGQDPKPEDNARTCQSTTGANGCNLYLYDSSRPAGHELSVVSAGDSSGGGPRVQGTVAVSKDGTRAYFVAKGVLTAAPNAQGQTAGDGQDNLYVFDAGTGTTTFIASLPGAFGDNQLWVQSTPPIANLTPDGRFLLFESRGRLTPDDSSSPGVGQLFRYDADSAALERISVGDDGFNDNGNAADSSCNVSACSQDATYAVPRTTGSGYPRLDPSMSDDGSRIFFQSPLGLTPHALDRVQIGVGQDGVIPIYAQNVYEWHAGHVSLISDGADASNVYQFCSNAHVLHGSSVCLLGADTTGDNVFFTTADRLVPQDTDTSVDFYDARVGGGIPYTPPSEPCSGDNCKSPPAGAPGDQTPGSAALNGPGNQRPSLGGSTSSKKPAAKKKSTKKKHAKKKSTKKKSTKNKHGAKKSAKKKPTTKHRQANTNRRSSK